MTKEISLIVNGSERTVQVEDHWTLLDLLHDALELRGTKDGCGEGVCGTCTVLVNGRAVRACLTLAVHARGAEVISIEGLAHNGELHRVQTAFLESGAVQCGYCTPGIIMMTTALLMENSKPTRSEVREALAGNLCRCSGYTKIVDAVMTASGSE